MNLSIVIPTYNRAHLIEETLASALACIREGDQIIVRDNCSTDGTDAVVARHAERHQALVLARAESNQGPVINWLEGVKLARNPLTLLLFSDDVLLPQKFDDFRQAFVASGTAVGFGGALIGSEIETASPQFQLPTQGIVDAGFYVSRTLRKLGSVPVSPAAYLFRTAALRESLDQAMIELGDNDNALSTGAGIDLLAVSLAVINAKKFFYMPTPHVFFRQHATSMSTAREGIVQHLYRQSRVVLAKQTYGVAAGIGTAVAYSMLHHARLAKRLLGGHTVR